MSASHHHPRAHPVASNSEARAMAVASGLKSNQSINGPQSNGPGTSLQEIAGSMNTFKRLQRAFDQVGWNLHYLDGDSTLAVHRKWQLSHICQTFDHAEALLHRIGGVTC